MLYILSGSDTFSRNEALRALKQELDTDGSLESNIAEFDAKQVSPAEVIGACNTVPFLGGRRLVVLEGALSQAPGAGRRRPAKGKAPADSEDASGRGPWWALAEYAAQMPETTALVLVDGDGVDAELLEALRPSATTSRFSLPAQRDAAGWVHRRARAIGLAIDGRGCAVLAELIGNDTGMLASELDKLAIYAAGERITEKDIRSLVADVRDQEGYLLADAVADGKPAVATKLLHQMLASGRHPAQLLLTIENRYRRIAVAREMADAGATGAAIGSRLKIEKAFAVDRLLDQVRRYPSAGVRWALDRIAQSDQDVKEGRYDENVSLELLIHELASPATASGSNPQRVSAVAASSW
jgi:DNA polymerase-3 subunit delta